MKHSKSLLASSLLLLGFSACHTTTKLNSPDAAEARRPSPESLVRQTPNDLNQRSLSSSQSRRQVQPLARDVISDGELAERMAGSGGTAAYVKKKAQPVVGARPKPDTSPYTNSIVLSDGEMYTLVPNGAILHLPVQLQQYVVEKPVGNFLLWPSFLDRNEAWLAAQEVPLDMAKGDAKAAARVMNALVDPGKVLVSVYRSNPISVLEEERANPDRNR